jgi:hypothetical protein
MTVPHGLLPHIEASLFPVIAPSSALHFHRRDGGGRTLSVS